jgi:signal transduction histidine kinase
MPIPGLLYGVFVAYFDVVVLMAFISLFIAYIKTVGVQRNQYLYLLIASIIGFSGTNDFFLTVYKSPFRLPFSHDWLISAYTAIFAYAVVQHRLMDIEVVIKKGIIYSTLMAAIVGVYSFLILLGQILFQNTLGINQWVATVITAFAIAVGFKPLESFITEITNEYFFKKKIDYQNTLKKSSEALSLLTNIDRLIRLSTRILARDMVLEEASTLIYDEAGHRYTVKAVAGKSKDLLGLALSDNHELFKHLFAAKRILLKDEIKHTLENKMLLPEERKRLNTIKKEMEMLHAHICVPSISRGKFIGNKLVAIFCIGDKKSGDMYTNEDIQLLSTLSNQAAVAVENAIMYSDLMKQFQELKETKDQLVQSEKLAALGTMAAGIAHEIRNPLTSLQLFVQMMAERYDDREFREKFTQIVPPEIERLNRIVNDLVSFAKPSKLIREPVQINDILDKTIRLSEISFRKFNVKVVKEFSEVPMVTVDSQQMMQIFLNLIMNGSQAMPTGGTLTVRTYYLNDINKKVCIDIKDTGVGISEENLKKLFAPFFTTKEGGTGLGLAITRRIVEEHKGEVKIKSKVGEGTTFTVELPAST